MYKTKSVKEQIVANVYVQGDESVGMFPISLKVTIEGLNMKRDIEDPTVEGRCAFREDLEKLFHDWLNYGRVEVSFSDECGDCYAILKEKEKHNCPAC